MIGQISGGLRKLKINGIIDEYIVQAGENVNAGDFVTFINNISAGTDTQLDSNTPTAVYMSAAVISDNKVFIAYTYRTGTVSNYTLDLYGLVCTISGTTITVGTPTQLDTTIQHVNENTISVATLSENKVFISYVKQDTYYYPYGLVCTINGTNITAGTPTKLNSTTISNYHILAVALSNSKVFITFGNYNNNNLYGLVCTIEDYTITAGNISTLYNNVNASEFYISMSTLSDNKVFIAYTYSSSTNLRLRGMVCVIEGTTITIGVATILDNETGIQAGNALSTIALSENKVFIVYMRYFGNLSPKYAYSLYGMICTIENSTITIDTSKVLISYTNNSLFSSCIVKLSNNKVFITYTYGGTSSSAYAGNVMYGLLCIIEDVAITVEDSIELLNVSANDYIGGTSGLISNISTLKLTDESIFTIHNIHSSDTQNNSSLYGIITNNTTYVKSFENYSNLNGVAMQEGTAGQTIKVMHPDN